VQAPTRYETVLNLKTAKALGLQVPDMISPLRQCMIDDIRARKLGRHSPRSVQS
jgi:hypothetical protein